MPLAFSSGISVEKEGAPAQNASEVRPTVDDCEHDAATITVRHNRVVPVTEAWLGLGGVDCASTRNRSLLTSTQMAPDCKRLGEPVLDAQRA